MGQYNGAVITTAGQAVLAQAIGGAELTITKVVTSATAIPPGADLTALTAIVDVEQTEQPTSVQVFNDNIVQISTRFSNAGVAAAYLIQTLGVFGQVTGGAETLLAVSTAITPDQMPAEDAIAPSAFIYNIQLTVQSADQITVTVNDAGTASIADIIQLQQADQTIITNIKQVRTASIPVSGWSASAPYIQTVAVAGISASDTPIISPVILPTNTAEEEKAIKKNFAFLSIAETLTDSIKLTCIGSKPTSDFSINIKGV